MTVKVGVECGGRLSSLAVSGDSVICSVVCPGIGKAHSLCNLLIGNEIVSESSLRQTKKVPFRLTQIVQNTQKSLSVNFICSCRFHNVVSFRARKGCLTTRQK